MKKNDAIGSTNSNLSYQTRFLNSAPTKLCTLANNKGIAWPTTYNFHIPFRQITLLFLRSVNRSRPGHLWGRTDASGRLSFLHFWIYCMLKLYLLLLYRRPWRCPSALRMVWPNQLYARVLRCAGERETQTVAELCAVSCNLSIRWMKLCLLLDPP